jgi:hypothetical protein
MFAGQRGKILTLADALPPLFQLLTGFVIGTLRFGLEQDVAGVGLGDRDLRVLGGASCAAALDFQQLDDVETRWGCESVSGLTGL